MFSSRLGLVLAFAFATHTAGAAVPGPKPFEIIASPELSLTATGPATEVSSILHPQLRSAAQAGAADWSTAGGLPPRLVRGDQVLVEIRFNRDRSAADLSGLVAELRNESNSRLIEAWVPRGKLEALALEASVARVIPARMVRPLIGASTSQGVASGNADLWHTQGVDGTGVTIAMIDTFDNNAGEIAALQASNDWPPNARLTMVKLGGGTFGDGGEPHGNATTEIAYDVAPGASFIAYDVVTIGDWVNAINLAVIAGVDVISASLGAPLDGIGDGTALPGSVAEAAEAARAAGVLLVNSAGNERQNHWSGSFTSSTGNANVHTFGGPATNVQINILGPNGAATAYCFPTPYPIQVELYWDDWAPPVDHDYRLELYKFSGGGATSLVATSDFAQGGGAADTPQEFISYTTTSGDGGGGCTGNEARYGVAIRRDVAATNRHFQLFASTSPEVRNFVHSNSLGFPADSAAVVTIAAADALTSVQETYSSEGPILAPGGGAPTGAETPRKPDVTSFANVDTQSYGPGVFNGTSSAAPHVAGMAALLIDRYPALGVDDVHLALQEISATGSNDLGIAGFEGQHGHGRMRFQEASLLDYLSQPSDADAGVAIAPAFEVGLFDTEGLIVPYSAQSTVSLSFGSDPSAGAAVITGNTGTLVDGIADFAATSIDVPGLNYTLVAATPAVTSDTSVAFDILTGSAAALDFDVQPSNTVAGQNIAPSVTVRIEDAGGNLVASATDAVTIALVNNPGGDTLGGTLTVNAVGGIATFNNLNLDVAATGYTLGASATGLTADTSAAFDITAAAAAALDFGVQPGNTNAAAPISPAVTVRIEDSFGNLVNTASNTIGMAIGNNPGGATLAGTTSQAAVNGVATFNDLSLNNAGSGYTLVGSATGLTSDTSSPFDILVSTATQLDFDVQPSDIVAGGTISPSVTVRIEDAGGNLVNTASNAVTLALAANPGGDVLTGTLTVNAVGGIATFSDLSLDAAANGYTLSANASGLSADTSSSFNVTAGAAAALDFGTEPSNTTAGANLSPAVTVRIEDSFGNLVSGATNSVTVALGANPGSDTLGGTLSVNAAGGVATFADLNLDVAAIGYTLTAASTGLTGDTSASFNITAGAAAALDFGVEPSNTAAGANISPAVTVRIEDSFGNLVSGATNSVTVALGANPGSDTLGGTLSVNAAGGVATFADLNLDVAAIGYTLTAASTGLTGDTSASFNITAGAAAALDFGVEPSNTAAGANISPAVTVRIEDSFGNLVSGATNSVTVALGANPGSDTLGGTLSVNAAGGVATFADLNLDVAAIGYTLTAASTGLTGDTSASFNITAGAAAALDFGVEPSNTAAGANISPAVTVRIEDSFGNLVSGATNSVTVALGANPGSDTLGGTLSVNAAGGVATFADLNLDVAAIGYTLTAASTGLTGDTSASFNITAGAAAALDFGVEPSNTAAGANISPAVTVRIEDSFGNLVSGATNSVTVALGANPGSDTLGGTLSVNAAGGVATFADLNLDVAAIGYTLTAASTGLTGDTSASFNITAGAAAALDFGVEPSNTAAGANISPAVTVRIEDSFGNLVSGATNSVTVALGANPGSDTLGGTLSVNAVGGVATFADLNLDVAAIGYTLTAASTGLTGDTSASFDVTAGGAAELAFVVEPSNIAAGGTISPAVTVQILDSLGNPVLGATNAVTLALGANPGSDTLGGTLTVNAVAGVATFADLSLDVAANGYTLTAASTGLTGDTSASFDVTAGGAAELAFVVEPSNIAAGGTISPAVTVQILDSLGNPVLGATNAVTLALGANPGSDTLGGTLTVNAVAGVATFADLSLDVAANGYTLTAASTGLTGDTSASFDVTAGGAAELAFVVEPSNIAAGGTISPAVTVQILDSLGNPVSGATNAVTLALGANPGSDTLGGTLTVNAVAGVATFADLSLDVAANGYTLTAASTGLTGDTSASFDVTAGGAAALAFGVEPSNIAAGGTISPAVTVEILDGFGNLVIGATNSVTVALGANPGGDTLGGTLTVNAAGGVATFANLSLDVAASGYTLAAASTGLTGDTSASFNVTAGAAAALDFGVEPSNTAAGANISPAVTVRIEDSFGNLVSGATNSVTVALGANPGGDTLGGTLSTNAVGGVATFADLNLDVAATGYTLTAASTGLAGDTSVSFDISAAAANALVWLTEAVTVDMEENFTVEIAIVDAFGNVLVDDNGTTLGVEPGNCSPGLLRGSHTADTVNGVASFSGLHITRPASAVFLIGSGTGFSSIDGADFDVLALPEYIHGNGFEDCGL